MDNPQNWFACLVCGDKTRFCYLKTQLCRACAAFYRRAVTENITYECQFEEKCKLDIRRRNICPACRFRKCRQLHPRLKAHHYESNGKGFNHSAKESTNLSNINQNSNSSGTISGFDKNNNEISDATIISPLQLIDSNRLFINESLVDVLVQGYDWYLWKQREMHVMLHPEVDFSSGKNLLVKDRSLPMKMIMDSLPLMYTMFNEFYRAFGGLPSEQKIKLAANAAYEINFLNKAYLTSEYYNKVEDRRMAMTNGYYVEHVSLDIKGYVYGLFMNKELEDFLNLYKPLSTRRFDNFQKFKQLGLNKRDCVCMMFLSMCRYIEYANLLNDEFLRLRERLLNEWHSQFKAENAHEKEGDVPKKFAQIFEYYLDTSNFTNDSINTMTILCLKNHRPDIQQLHSVSDCMKKLNEAAPIVDF